MKAFSGWCFGFKELLFTSNTWNGGDFKKFVKCLYYVMNKLWICNDIYENDLRSECSSFFFFGFMKSMFFIFILVRFYLLVWQFLSCCFFSFFFLLVSGLWVIKAYTYILVVTELFHCFPWNNETQSGSSCIFRAIWVEMAATGASFVKVKRHILGFTTVLKSVACEFYFSATRWCCIIKSADKIC